MPLTLIANQAIYQLFLENHYKVSTQVVSRAGEEIELISQSGQPEEKKPDQDGVFSSRLFEALGNAVDSTKQALNLGDKVQHIKARATEMIEHLIQLSAIFILQTGIMPIIFLWLFLQLAKWAFRARIS